MSTKLIEILFQMRTLTWFSWKAAVERRLPRLPIAPPTNAREIFTRDNNYNTNNNKSE